ncbi:MAG TPA: helix-turn-helix transcriptional regulator [Phycicoccus sp.]|nr:helix-turn-helix transcriptional regulator [Phycicoccus sp.]HQK30742.1 helix-turn-helix transcriptional regulator [Phycicoccus sp.]
MPESRRSRNYARAAELMGRRVAATREVRGLTQEQLAHLTGLSRNQIQNIERNRNNSKDPETGKPGPGNARLETIFVLAEALHVEVSWLVDTTTTVLIPPADSM